MQQKKLFIRAAVFYNKSRWHFLIKECIAPLTADLQRKDKAAVFFVSFSTYQGDNIRLSVAVPHNEAKRSASVIDQHIKKFLAAHPSPALPQNFSLTEFFMYLPNNTLKYNLYKIRDDLASRNGSIRYGMSKAILQAFRSEPVARESLFSFIIYSQAIIIKSIYPDRKSAAEAVHILLRDFTSELSPEQVTGLDHKTAAMHTKNWAVLEAIINDVWENRDNYPEGLKWLNGIRTLAKKDFEETASFRETFMAINHALCKQANMHHFIGILNSVNLLAKIIV